MNATDRRVRKSKDAMKKALIELMAEREFRSISITDIVSRADVSRGTFYKHYGYREDLLHELIEDVIADLVESYRKPYRLVEVFDVSHLDASTIRIFEHVFQYAVFYKVALEPAILPGFQQRMCEILKGLMLHDFLKGETGEETSKELQASYAVYALLGMIVYWKERNFSYTPAYMAEQLIQILQQDGTVYRVNAVKERNGTVFQG